MTEAEIKRETLQRVEALLAQLEELRAKLEASRDPDEAYDLMVELAEIAKAAHAELERARAEAT